MGGGNVPGPTLLATWGLAGGTVPVGPRATRWVQPWKAAQSCIQEGPSILFAFFFLNLCLYYFSDQKETKKSKGKHTPGPEGSWF